MRTKSTRESGVELLRILAAIGIVYSHFLISGKYSDDVSLDNYLWFDLLRVPVASAVDVFLVIMGYFSCSTQKRTFGKPLGLIAQMIFYGLVLYLCFVVLGLLHFSLNEMVGYGLPLSWFITLYLVVYFLSPYFNIIFLKFSKREWHCFLLFLIAFFSIWPMILGILESAGHYFEEWSTIGRNGDYAGYHIITFFLMYAIGAYIRFSRIDEKISNYNIWAIILSLWVGNFVLRLLPIESSPWHIARWYDNILVVLMAGSFFIAFKKIKIHSRIINHFAAASFTIYLIHQRFFQFFDTYSILRMTFIKSIAYIFAIIFMICFCSWLLYYFYKFTLGSIISKYGRGNIHYFDNEDNNINHI